MPGVVDFAEVSKKLVTIASFSYVVEAYVPKSRPESKGIKYLSPKTFYGIPDFTFGNF